MIPGWASHPDKLPASPSAFDDEFDGPLDAAWTQINAAQLTVDAGTSFPSHLYMAVTPTTGEHTYGIYKPAPTPPFTVTCKVVGNIDFSDGSYCYQAWGLGVGEATPGRYVAVWTPNNEYTNITTTVEFNEWVNPDLFSRSLTLAPEAEGVGMFGEWYLRLVVASASSIASFYSPNGRLWIPRYPAYAPSPSFAGGGLSVILGEIQNPPSSKGCSAVYDWVRFTTP